MSTGPLDLFFFRGATLLSLYQASFQYITDNVCILLITMAEKDPDVINIPGNDDGDDWQDIGPINVKEVVAYKEKVNEVFEMMSLMIVDDHKDVVCATVTSFKKLAAKHWKVMQDADVEVVVRSIHDSAGMYLCQALTEGGIDVIDTAQEVPNHKNSSDHYQRNTDEKRKIN